MTDKKLDEIEDLIAIYGSVATGANRERIMQLIKDYALQARIDELKHLREFWGETIDHTLGKPIKLKFVGLEDIDRRIVELKAPHKNERSEK